MFLVNINSSFLSLLNVLWTFEDAEVKPGFFPLLPRPPKNAQEVEELRQRRRSSDTASITQSLKADDESSDDEQFEKSKAALRREAGGDTGGDETKKNGEAEPDDEYLLELPDEDDSAPLADFNDKCELKRYSDDTYGVLVLVRQPFRNASVLYKNALQKFTEVRTWTEYLVRLVTVSENEKKLYFYNAHELLTMATEQEVNIDDIVESCIIEKPVEEIPEDSNGMRTLLHNKVIYIYICLSHIIYFWHLNQTSS